MTNVIQYALLGIGLGAIYTLLGQGIVLIYRGSGVLNIAHGGFAMFGAYLYLQLHVPGSMGTSFSAQQGWPVLPSFAVAVLATAAIGLATDQLLLRGMRNASPLARLIATVGVLLVLIAAASKIWGGSPPFVPAILPTDIWQLSSTITLPSSYVWMVVIAAVATTLLAAMWRFTRIGWVTAAVSQNERGAAALGISPGFVSSATWSAGAGLAAAAGILLTPITQVSVGGLSLLVIPVLAALLLGGFQSFPATFASGMFVGIAQTVALNYNDFFEQRLHITMASDAFPVLVVLLVMIVRGSSLPLRGHIGERLPAIGTGRIHWPATVIAIAVGLIAIFSSSNPTTLAAVAVTFTVATLLLSLVVLMGYAGQISLAQYALAGIGGLIAARLALKYELGLAPALVIGMLGATAAGLLIAVPALRLRGVNLAVITLAAAWAIHDMVFANPRASGDAAGIAVGRAQLFGWEISGSTHPARYAAFTLVVFALVGVLVANLRRSRFGRRMIAVRSNERAAAASGVAIFRTKLLAFAVSGAIAGLAGTLAAFQYESTSFVTLDAFTSLLAVAWVVIGAVGFVLGAVIGAILAPGALLSLIGLHWHGFGDWLALIGGVGVLLAVRFNQNGITYGITRGLSRYTAKFGRRLPWRKQGNEVTVPTATVEPKRVVPQRLRIQDLTVRYGAVLAVDSISIDVAPGEIVGLIGPNGAGKTSLMDAVSGFASCQGHVRLDDRRIDQWSPHRRARAGLVRSFQGLELFPELTILENLQVPNDADGTLWAASELLRPRKMVLPPVTLAAVQDFGLAPILHKLPDEISYGERRLVAIARAVAAQPSVLLLDEPVAGLSEHESAEFAVLVRRLADTWGMAILVIEHDMGFVMNTCDRITVMNFGKHVCEGNPDQVRANEAAIAAYLGDDAQPPQTDPIHASEADNDERTEARL
ncbi:ATP-binding cassette domain-containing protein [Nocardia sp. NPDC059246]|uniref:ABC transporter permease subunit n=1 Tax=unclassified Nocardia TaxID=2637762 RepID=UPI0036C4230B